MEYMFNMVRHVVSADKKRFVENDVDLDLAFITDRIIAMSFPAGGVESMYRNNIDQVSSFLKAKYGNNFKIFNLSQRPYDYSKFNHKVESWCGFPDHHSPPLALLKRTVSEIHKFLEQDPANIVVVHCLAGKGRTGTIISAYCYYCGLFASAEESLNYFAICRSITNWGVSGPSQKRYVGYFETVQKNEVRGLVEPLLFKKIEMTGIPRLDSALQSGFCPIVRIYKVLDTNVIEIPEKDQKEGGILVFDSSKNASEVKTYSASRDTIAEFEVGTPVVGDLLIKFLNFTPLSGKSPLFRVALHTCFVGPPYKITFNKAQIDGVEKDTRYPSNFSITLHFEQLDHAALAAKQLAVDPRVVAQLVDEITPIPPPNDASGAICFFGTPQDKAQKVANTRQRAKQTTRQEKAGWLIKQGHQVKNWKLRWFVLKNNVLSYFKSPQHTSPQGIIPINEVTSLKKYNGPTNDATITEYFMITTIRDNYLIHASEEIMDDWIDALTRACQAYREKQKSSAVGNDFEGFFLLNNDIPTTTQTASNPAADMLKSSAYCNYLENSYGVISVLQQLQNDPQYEKFVKGVYAMIDTNRQLRKQIKKYEEVIHNSQEKNIALSLGQDDDEDDDDNKAVDKSLKRRTSSLPLTPSGSPELPLKPTAPAPSPSVLVSSTTPVTSS